MPVVYPRKNVTIVEKESVAQVLKKYGLEIPDLWTQPDALMAEMAKKQVPETLETALAGPTPAWRRTSTRSKRRSSPSSPPSRVRSTSPAAKSTSSGNSWRRRSGRRPPGKNETAARQLRKAADNLFPDRRLQERVFNVVPYLIKYGYAFLEKLDQAVDIDEHDHQVLPV